MSDIAIPVLVLSGSRDDVELYNKTLRDAGHAVRCRGLNDVGDLETALEQDTPHLIVFFARSHSASIGEIARLKQVHAPSTPLIVITDTADETAISEAMQAGAQDLVSVAHRERISAVSQRELKAFRLERSLTEALQSAMQYKLQLKSLLSNSADAIAIVQEGIVVEANEAWARLFAGGDIDAALGPLMDCFAGTCQAELKTALVACGRGRSARNTLCVSPAGPAAATVNLTLEPISHDGDPAVRLSVERQIQPDRAKTPAELVEHSLHTDIATGFLQRRQFLDLLGEQAESQNTERCRVLAFVQPDRFDEIESDLGPVSSEEIIGQIAAVLDKLMDESDLGGRYSGNVLGLVLERDNLRDVETWTEYALGRISERVFEVADRTLSLTCSFGLVEIGSGPERIDDLIRNAERTLERAREEGGNCKSIEETADESTRIRRIDEIRVRQIRSALVDGRFRLMHLNVASLAGKSERIFDTFVRLVDEQGDEIAATEFMESAARNNMLRPVDRWVLDATLDFCAREASDVVFIKLSHESILDESLLSWVAERTGAAKIAPGRICFQVTEDDASKYQKQTGLLAQQLQSRGFRFAVEKFGMGRDPLRVLQTTPMDFVKFDGSLSQLLGQNSPIQEKLRGLVAAAKTQDIRTIATQVENANTMTLLFQLGVGYMQGHYLHEPEVVLEAAV